MNLQQMMKDENIEKNGRQATLGMPAPRSTISRWSPPMQNPATLSYTAAVLLLTNSFFDKSAALHQLLSDTYIQRQGDGGDFISAPLLVVFPRRFAKTTLLGFMKAIFSPLQYIDNNANQEIKAEIRALEKGPELLAFGERPVIYLDMISVSTDADLEDEVEGALISAGLDEGTIRSWGKGLSPVRKVMKGAAALNESFDKSKKTIMLIDEYDKVHRDATPDPKLLQKISDLYNITKSNESPISLLMLCGLTRIVGTGLSTLNNLVDVSQNLKYHGICGISARELTKCVGTQLDNLAQNKYNQDFKGIVDNEFRIRWNGFRFGFMGTIGMLDPEKPEGALFSPIDVWEMITSLKTGSGRPSSVWMETMQSELAFSSFGKKYTEKETERFALLEMLSGGWISKTNLKKTLKREDYVTLSNDIHVKKVFLELGFLTVNRIDDTMVLLSPPNWAVTENAMMQLTGKVQQGLTSEKQALSYLSEDGLKTILSIVEKKVNNDYGVTGAKAMREYPFQDHTYFQLLLRFPELEAEESRNSYELYKEVFSSRTSTSKKLHGFNDIAVELRYGGAKKRKVYLMELKIAKILTNDKNSIDSEHKNNLDEATKQLRTYVWKETTCKAVEMIAISGVWHPVGGDVNGGYSLVTKVSILS